jgi:hypothetical protein
MKGNTHMKKSLLILPLLVVSLAGCDPATSDVSDAGQLLAIEVIEGLKEEYEQNAQVDLAEVEIRATYENTTLTITGEDLTFNPTVLDTSELGEFEITISYLTESVVWTYSVVEYYEIDNIGAPEFVTTYFANIEAKTPENARSEFMDRAQGYAVGDDNAFKFLPTIYAYNSDGDEITVSSYHSSSLIQEKQGAEWVTLSGAELDAIVAIDEFASTYDFTEAAIGKTYKLTVRPYGERYELAVKYATSFEFTIVNGYNVYTQDDLSHFNNVGTLWDAYRTANGITLVDIDGIVFQNDIEIVRAKLPDTFFYMAGDADIKTSDSDYERALGSLRDDYNLYHRDIPALEEFVFNGNYFNLDYTSLPVVARESGRIDAEAGLVISHATVIKAGVGEIREEVGDYVMKNLSIVGNANRTEIGEKSGGAIFTKLLSVEAHLYNLIASQCFTIILSEFYCPTITVEKARGYDTFSSMLYNFGTDYFLIKDSEFIGAGGPIMITDHVYPLTDGTGGYQPHTEVQNSVLESWVSGSENWFRLVHADAVAPQLSALGENLLPVYGTNSITKIIKVNGIDVPHFNLIGMIKDASVAAPTSTKVSGTFQIDQGIAFPNAMPRFQSTGGQMALFDGEKLVDTSNSPIVPYQYTQTNYFTGDYMNLYYNIAGGDGYMGLIFELVERTV